MNETPPTALAPIFTTPEPNRNISLYEGPLVLTLSRAGVLAEGRGHIAVEWLPTPRLRFRHYPNDEGDLRSGDEAFGPAMLGSGSGVESSCAVDGVHVAFPGPSYYTGVVDSVEQGKPELLSEVLFHVVNFVGRGAPIRDVEGSRGWLGRNVLEAGGWRITLDWVGPRAYPARQTDEGHGYEITHVSRLDRLDRTGFAADDARRVRDLFYWLLTFASGQWCGVMLPVGFNTRGDRVWEEWSVPKMQAWIERWGSRSWYLRQSGALAAIFGPMLTRWDDPAWREILRLAIDMYVSANVQSSSQLALVVAQAALELLSWAVLVEERRALSAEGFDRLRASDRIRLLLELADIPRTIPPTLDELISVATARKWGDGPRATTELRNAVVHPTRGRSTGLGTPGLPWHDAAWLSLWYVELVILRLLEYAGTYRSRLTYQEETVPWAAPDSEARWTAR